MPPGFVVTANTYRQFLVDTGLDEELADVFSVDPDDSQALAEAAHAARTSIRQTEVPLSVREAILATYDDLEDSPSVAVRSSATAEDLPEASFAGQQDTYLNVTREVLVEWSVSAGYRCLPTERATITRSRALAKRTSNIAVVVQRMVDADKAGPIDE